MLSLKDVTVVTLEQAVAAPYCSCRLADMGARVIKIEREEGDFARQYDHVVHGESAYFIWLNRGKESVVLNIKDKQDLALMHNILAKTDVFIQNLGPHAAERADLGSDDLRLRNNQLITCDISGYGHKGEYQDKKAYDLLVQCETGLASITGGVEAPGRVGISVCDIACGQQAYTSILEALIMREQTGTGCAIKISLFDSIAEWMNVPYLHYRYANTVQQRVGINHATIAPYGLYISQDQKSVVFSIQNEREWLRFCDHVLCDDQMKKDSRFIHNDARVTHRLKLNQAIDDIFNHLALSEIEKRLDHAGIAYGHVNDIAGLAAHPQLRHQKIETPSGSAEIIAKAAQFSDGLQMKDAITVPRLGEHTQAIRTEFSKGDMF